MGGAGRGGAGGCEMRVRPRDERLRGLHARLQLARGLPPEEAVCICKTIVNDSILDDGAALEGATGARSE